jgi:hypothetical protein
VEQADLLFAGDALAARDVKGFFLPPVRTSPEGYFSRVRADIRVKLQTALGETLTETPAVCAAWVFTTCDLARDLLMDGGSVDFTNTPGAPTRMTMRCFGGSPTAEYRAKFFLSPESISPTPEARSLAESIRSDLNDRAGGMLDLSRTEASLAWDSGPSRPFSSGAVDIGSWQRLEHLSSCLDPGDRNVFYEMVLLPSAQRVGANADHDLAERLLLHHFWHCPWSASTDLGPWRQAVMHVLTSDARGRQGFLESYPEVVQETVESRDGAVHLSHREVSTVTTLLWRLVVPLGSVLRPRGTLMLDRGFRSRLDCELVLG